MNLRKLLLLAVSIITLAASGSYVFIYLYRWEWNRAVISGIIFLAAEIAIVGWTLNNKLSDTARRSVQPARVDVDRTRRIAGHLDVARDQPSRVFEWLKPDGSRLGVFVPILMGAGLLLSALAWMVERIARATAGRASDRQLASTLSALAPPPGGFLDDRNDPLRDLRGPAGGRW